MMELSKRYIMRKVTLPKWEVHWWIFMMKMLRRKVIVTCMLVCVLNPIHQSILFVEEKNSPEFASTAATKHKTFAEKASTKHRINAAKSLIAPAVRKIAADNNVC